MLDSLHHLLLIDEHGTFTAAARAAHLSQPALSASIQRLEEQMGAALLVRDRRGARPTAAGEALLPFARATLGAVRDGRAAVASAMDLQIGEVRLAAGATACTWLLPPTLARFRAEYPGISLQLRQSSTRDILQALASGAIDLGIVTGLDEPTGDHTIGALPAAMARLPRGVVRLPWRADTLVVVAPPSDGKPPVRDAPWVAFHPGTPTRALLDRYEPNATIAATLGGVGAVVALTRAGLGRALVSEVAVRHTIARGELAVQPTAWSPVTRQLDLVFRGTPNANAPPTPTLEPAAAALWGMLVNPTMR